jgi:hypothetical protein
VKGFLQEEHLLLVFAFPMLVISILYREAVHAKDLPEHTKYEQKVRYRLLPYVWYALG